MDKKEALENLKTLECEDGYAYIICYQLKGNEELENRSFQKVTYEEGVYKFYIDKKEQKPFLKLTPKQIEMYTKDKICWGQATTF